MTDDKPADPLTPAEDGAAQLHEFFTNLRRAGFTLEEAAAVIGAIFRANQ